MQEHYRLADIVGEAEANLIFNSAARKVIKDAFRHARCISIATFYTQVKFASLLHACVEVIDFFTLTYKCNSFLHACVEVVDKAHRGPRDLSDQGSAPSGWSQLVG
jgi:hypothetical protein